MAAKRSRKPEPISKHIVCSACGLSWEAHGKEPTLEKCVALLKAELAKRPSTAVFSAGSNTTVPFWTYTGGGVN